MATLKTYDLKGNKLSFANWISNLSPTETPFSSMIKKEAVDQTRYSWQIDRLSAPINAGVREGAEFVSGNLTATQVMSNFTQILRKVVKVTDTANKVGLYGRASEKAYQMEKAGKELRRDVEFALLQNGAGVPGTSGSARKMGGFVSLVAPVNQADRDTGAVVHKIVKAAGANGPAFTEDEIFDMTYNLYLAGSKADKVMVHPKHIVLFSGFINKSPNSNVKRMFKNVDDKFNAFVKSFRDPLGQTYEIIPNRFMPEDKIFFFTESDWTQMVLREPKTVELAKTGSAEKHMMEVELGLRHRNPFASGVIELQASTAADTKTLHVRSTTSPDLAVLANTTMRLNVDAYTNGVLDHTADAQVTLKGEGTCFVAATGSGTSVDGTTTMVGGTAAWTAKSAVPGQFTVKLSAAGFEDVSVILTFVSVRSAEGGEEVVLESAEVAAPKGRKAKA